ncbi:ribonuclease HII [Pigmentibacter sp. JX0631]|uniref:ribonuclease HII n=1 Tax=Pigmentibacter sp. JX0631 TaxID=2976982 RepID=UPI002469917A|nr:ribonuclease HII [Pigmentibacter sp. JX0631]WGL60639.1 ribonuclease HII [Pigmentibacter sp. JX0631]
MSDSKSNFFQNEFFLLNYLLKEQIFNYKSVPLIISIDEVGRGCVAGSVVSCVSLWADLSAFQNSLSKNYKKHWLHLINDSKKLTEKKRQECFDIILRDYEITFQEIICGKNNNIESFQALSESKNKLHFKAEEFSTENIPKYKSNLECLQFIIGQASPLEIDTLNIWNAVQLSVGRALIELQKYVKNNFPFLTDHLSNALILMDGKHFLKVPQDFSQNLQVTVTKADGIFVSVGLSSIIAKVFRDTQMIQQDKKFPLFGFAKHKGYGTASHLNLIQSHGICEIHRKSFLANHLHSNL